MYFLIVFFSLLVVFTSSVNAKPLGREVIRNDIDVHIQFSLQRLSKMGGAEERAANEFLSHIIDGKFDGAFLDNQQVPALRAKRFGTWWGRILPNGKTYTILMGSKDGEQPIIVFNKNIATNKALMDSSIMLAHETMKNLIAGRIDECSMASSHLVGDIWPGNWCVDHQIILTGTGGNEKNGTERRYNPDTENYNTRCRNKKKIDVALFYRKDSFSDSFIDSLWDKTQKNYMSHNIHLNRLAISEKPGNTNRPSNALSGTDDMCKEIAYLIESHKSTSHRNKIKSNTKPVFFMDVELPNDHVLGATYDDLIAACHDSNVNVPDEFSMVSVVDTNFLTENKKLPNGHELLHEVGHLLALEDLEPISPPEKRSSLTKNNHANVMEPNPLEGATHDLFGVNQVDVICNLKH